MIPVSNTALPSPPVSAPANSLNTETNQNEENADRISAIAQDALAQPCDVKARKKPATLESKHSHRPDDFKSSHTIVEQDGLKLSDVHPDYKANKEIVLKAVCNNGLALQYASDDLKNNEEIVQQAISNNGLALQYASVDLRNNEEIALKAANQNLEACQHFSEQLCLNRDFILKLVKDHPLALRYFPEDWCTVEDVVTTAILSNGLALQYASVDLKNNEEIALKAASQNLEACQHFSEQLCLNRDFILKLVKAHPSSLSYIPEDMCTEENISALKENTDACSNTEFMLKAIKKFTWAIEYASDSLRSNPEFIENAVEIDGLAFAHAIIPIRLEREIFLKAVKKCGWLLQHANTGLKGDKELVLEAVSQCGDALYYASEKLRSDRDVVLAAVRQDGRALQYASKTLCSDPNVVLTAVSQSGTALYFASDSLRSDPEFVLKAYRNNESSLGYAGGDFRSSFEGLIAACLKRGLQNTSEFLKADKDIVRHAVKRNASDFKHADPSLLNDRTFVLAAVGLNGDALQCAHKTLRSDKGVVLAAVRQDGLALKHAHVNLSSDNEVVLAAVRQNGLALRFASKELRNDQEIGLAAVRQDGLALRYAGEKLSPDKDVVFAAVSENGFALNFASKKLQNDEDLLEASTVNTSDSQKSRYLAIEKDTPLPNFDNTLNFFYEGARKKKSDPLSTSNQETSSMTPLLDFGEREVINLALFRREQLDLPNYRSLHTLFLQHPSSTVGNNGSQQQPLFANTRRNEKLKCLHLVGLDNENTIPFQLFPNLTTVVLHDMPDLVSLGDIERCQGIETLVLEGLTQLPRQELEKIGKLRKLKRLILFNFPNLELPSQIVNLKDLEILDITLCGEATIPQSLCRRPSLTIKAVYTTINGNEGHEESDKEVIIWPEIIRKETFKKDQQDPILGILLEKASSGFSDVSNNMSNEVAGRVEEEDDSWENLIDMDFTASIASDTRLPDPQTELKNVKETIRRKESELKKKEDSLKALKSNQQEINDEIKKITDKARNQGDKFKWDSVKKLANSKYLNELYDERSELQNLPEDAGKVRLGNEEQSDRDEGASVPKSNTVSFLEIELALFIQPYKGPLKRLAAAKNKTTTEISSLNQEIEDLRKKQKKLEGEIENINQTNDFV